MVVIIIGKIQTSEELIKEDGKLLNFETEENSEISRMLKESQEQYKSGMGMSPKELLKSLSKKDFM